MRGRKPKPVETHERNGNPSRLDLKSRLLISKKINRERPSPPDHLDKTAREHWEKIVPDLEAMGTLAKIDAGSLEALCQAYSNMTRAAKDLKKLDSLFYKTPNGSLQQIPQIGIFNKSASLYKSYASEFGLTPSSRTRVDMPDGDTTGDKMGEILDAADKAALQISAGTANTKRKQKIIKLEPGETWRQ